MVVGLLLNNWGTWGGSATYHTSLVRGLEKIGHEVLIALPFKQELWDIPSGFDFRMGMQQSIKAMQASSTWVVWGIGQKLNLKSLLARKKTKPRVIAVNHGSSDNKWSRACLAGEAPSADAVVGVSNDSLGAIPTEHVHKGIVISGAVERSRLVPVSSQKAMRLSLGLRDDEKVLLYLGRISTEKRVDLAIEAMRYMPDNWRMLVVGEASNQINPSCLYNNFKVQFCGPTSFPGDYLQLADCFVSPSNLEGFGLSVVEAMTFGVPVVAHKVGVLGELEVGTIIPVDSKPQEFAAAIIRADLEREKAKRDSQIVSSMFSLESFIDRWSSLL